MNGNCSEWTQVRSGTPEGSLLSPLLFALFVNDLPDKIRTNCLLFADDVKLYHKISSPEDTKLLQADLDGLCQWSADWKLQLNPVKCKSLTITLKRKPVLATYTVHNTPLETVPSIRDLGIWLDTKLTFVDHINFTVSKANRALGALIRSLQTGRSAGGLQTEPILAAYFGNIRSVLEYGCIIWGGAAKTNLDRIDRIQHKFLIWLASHVHSSRPQQSLDYQDLLASFKITSLARRRLQYDVLFVHKILSGKVDSAFLLGSFPLHVPARHTRAMVSTLMDVPYGRVETIKRGLFCRAPGQFNAYLLTCPHSDPFACTFSAFRSQVRSFVRQSPL